MDLLKIIKRIFNYRKSRYKLFLLYFGWFCCWLFFCPLWLLLLFELALKPPNKLLIDCLGIFLGCCCYFLLTGSKSILDFVFYFWDSKSTKLFYTKLFVVLSFWDYLFCWGIMFKVFLLKFLGVTLTLLGFKNSLLVEFYFPRFELLRLLGVSYCLLVVW